MKYTNLNTYIFSTIKKYFNTFISNFINILKKVDMKKYYQKFKKNNIYRATKFLNFRYYNLNRLYKYLNFRNFNLNKIYKYLDFKKEKEIFIYIILPLIFFSIVYLAAPKFYKYEQTKIAKIACKGVNIKCNINGKVKYSFFPSPRIVISELIFADKSKGNIIYGKVNKAIIKLSFKNLLNKKRLNYKKVKIINSELNINIENLITTKDLITNKFIFEPLVISSSKVNFFDGNKFLADIKNVNFFFKTKGKKKYIIIKRKFS